jgi:hypothetical protein
MYSLKGMSPPATENAAEISLNETEFLEVLTLIQILSKSTDVDYRLTSN